MDSHTEISFFSIPIDSLSKEQLLFALRKRFQQKRQTSIVTANPEILLQARKSKKFADILRTCTFRIVDGFGISVVSLLKFQKRLYRCVGRDALDTCLSLAKEFHLSVGIIGGERGIPSQAINELHYLYPEVDFVDLSMGEEIRVGDDGVMLQGIDVVRRAITNHRIGIVVVGFGAQKQEAWILHFLEQHKDCLCGIGVGGILDVLAHKVKKSPYFFSALGLEWLWRLVVQPSRFTRILNAVIVFPFKALIYDK